MLRPGSVRAVGCQVAQPAAGLLAMAEGPGTHILRQGGLTAQLNSQFDRVAQLSLGAAAVRGSVSSQWSLNPAPEVGALDRTGAAPLNCRSPGSRLPSPMAGTWCAVNHWWLQWRVLTPSASDHRGAVSLMPLGSSNHHLGSQPAWKAGLPSLGQQLRTPRCRQCPRQLCDAQLSPRNAVVKVSKQGLGYLLPNLCISAWRPFPSLSLNCHAADIRSGAQAPQGGSDRQNKVPTDMFFVDSAHLACKKCAVSVGQGQPDSRAGQWRQQQCNSLLVCPV